MSNAHSKPIQYEFVMFKDKSYHKVPRQILIKEIEEALPWYLAGWDDEEVNTAINNFVTKPKSEQIEEILVMFIKRCEETCPPWKLQEGEDAVDQAVGWLLVGLDETVACAALGRVEL